MNNPALSWAEDLNKYLIREDMQMENEHTKICLTLHIIRNYGLKQQ